MPRVSGWMDGCLVGRRGDKKLRVAGVLTAGACPEKSLGRAMVQMALAGLFRGIMLCYLGYFNGIVKKCHFRRRAQTEDERKNN